MSREKYGGLKVLIVADSRTMRVIIRDLLVTIGFSKENLQNVADGETALLNAGTGKYDLITSNLWMLPPINGLELLRKIRAHENITVRNTPFLFITGERRIEYFKEAMDRGADGYLAKPLKISEFEKAIEKIFRKENEIPSEIAGLDKTPGKSLSMMRLKDLDGINILIIDDSQTKTTLLKNSLEGYGLIFQEASSGEEGLKILSKSIPDLIILDIVLPGIDGFEVCRRIKSNKATGEIPVIFITSEADVNDVFTGFSLGGTDYLIRPFQQAELLMRVMNQLHLRKVLTEKENLINDLLYMKEKKEELIEELLVMKEKLEVYANRDSLTTLLNRRGMNECIETEKGRFERNRIPFVLIMGDIDHFKKVNDTYGHDVGDHILIEISRILKQSLRRQDYISRWGGEEFLILLSETDLEGGLAVTEKFRKEVEAEEFMVGNKKLAVTMSFGLSEYNDNEVEIEQCIKQADEYLYRAKEAGRNRVFCGQTH